MPSRPACSMPSAARALGRLEQLRPLAYTNETALAHAYAGMFHANLLAVVGRLDDATARAAEGIEQAGREGNALALETWAVYSGWVHLAAGRLSAAQRSGLTSKSHRAQQPRTRPGLPYVGRFACDWHRLTTTDPHPIHCPKRTPSRGHLGRAERWSGGERRSYGKDPGRAY